MALPPNLEKLCGWVHDWRETDSFVASLRRPMFAVSASPLRDSGKGKTVVLSRALTKVLGEFPVHLQTIGDCVSHGWGLGVDVLKAVQIVAGEAEAFEVETATEAIYALSRVEIGGGRLGNSDGSIGAWAAKSVTEYGTLLRKAYDGVDFSTYSGPKARSMGRRGAGLPDQLEDVAREHPVRTVSLVSSYEEARDAIANGYPIPVCSGQGFASKRDAQGFARPSGSWAHCMLFLGVDDSGNRPGLLCQNSWGTDWITGPKRHDQPEGSFWVDAEVADRMLRKDPDSFSMSGFEGYPARDIDYVQI